METIGRYTVVGELGVGGVGRVLRVKDPTGRELALKLLQAATPAAGERFRRETRLQELLGEEAGFVPLLDMGVCPYGPYLVMPLLPGGTLRDQAGGQPMGVARSVALVAQLAEAMGRAHAIGVVHRDLKPDNVLFNQSGDPLIADLGLAKHFRHDVSGASQSRALSRVGETRGTPGYMAPEQLGSASQAGPRADVFALGAILQECLTGVPAFRGDTLVELLARIAEGHREPLPDDCPRELRGLLDRALSLDPKRRPGDGKAFAAALRAVGRPRGPRRDHLLALLTLLALAAVALVVRGPSSKPGPTSSQRLRSSTSPATPPTGPGVRLDAKWALAQPAVALHMREAEALAINREGLFALARGRSGVQMPLALGLSGTLGAKEGKASISTKGDIAVVVGEGAKLCDTFTGQLVAESPPGAFDSVCMGPVRQAVFATRGRELLALRLRGKGRLQVDKIADLPQRGRVLLSSSAVNYVAVGQSVHRFRARRGDDAAPLNCGQKVVDLGLLEGDDMVVLTEAGDLIRFSGDQQVGLFRTGLSGARDLAVAGTACVVSNPHSLCLVNTQTWGVSARLDFAALGTELVQVSLSPRARWLGVATKDGAVYRYALPTSARDRVPSPPVASWGEAEGASGGRVGASHGSGNRVAWADDETKSVHVFDSATRRTRCRPQRLPVKLIRVLEGGQVLTMSAFTASIWSADLEHELMRVPAAAGLSDSFALQRDQALLLIRHGRRLQRISLTPRTTELLELGSDLKPSGALTQLPSGEVAFAESGGKLALLGPNLKTRRWSVAAGEQDLKYLQPARDGGSLLSASHDGQIQRTTLAGEPLWSFKVGEGVLGLSCVGRRVLVTLEDRLVLWDEERAQVVGEVATVDWGEGGVGHLQGDGEHVVLLARNGEFRILELWAEGAGGQLSPRQVWPRDQPDPAQALSFSRGGDHVITAGTRTLRVHAIPSGEVVSQTEVDGVQEFALGGTLALAAVSKGSAGSRLREWTFAGGTLAPRDPRSEGYMVEAERLALSSHGVKFAFTGRNGRGLFVRDEAGTTRAFPRESVRRLSVSRGGRLVASWDDRTVVIQDATTGAVLSRDSVIPPRQLRVLSFLPTSPALLALAGSRGELRIVDPESARVHAKLRIPNGALRVAGSAKGDLLATRSGSGSLDLWSIPAGTHLRRFRLGDDCDRPREIAVSSDGRWLAATTTRGRVELFDLR